MDSECCECTSAVPYTFLQYHIYLPEDNHWDSPLPPGISGSVLHLPVKHPESSLRHHRPLCNPVHQNLQFLHCSDPRSYRLQSLFYLERSDSHTAFLLLSKHSAWSCTDRCLRFDHLHVSFQYISSLHSLILLL